MGPFWRIYYPKEFTESMEILNRFIEPFVERALSQCKADIEAKENSGQPVNFTDSLSLFTRNRTVLRDQLVSTLLAGRDTTACNPTYFIADSRHIILAILRVVVSSGNLRQSARGSPFNLGYRWETYLRTLEKYEILTILPQ